MANGQHRTQYMAANSPYLAIVTEKSLKKEVPLGLRNQTMSAGTGQHVIWPAMVALPWQANLADVVGMSSFRPQSWYHNDQKQTRAWKHLTASIAERANSGPEADRWENEPEKFLELGGELTALFSWLSFPSTPKAV